MYIVNGWYDFANTIKLKINDMIIFSIKDPSVYLNMLKSWKQINKLKLLLSWYFYICLF